MPSRFIIKGRLQIEKYRFNKDYIILGETSDFNNKSKYLHWEVKHFSTNRKGNQLRLQK